MASVVDNVIAYRVLSMLVKPFDETDAFRLGIIDADGNNLIKQRDLKTSEQRDAYTYLHRLVFNLKRIINKLPGGESKLRNIIAAMFLLKESYASRTVRVDEARFIKIVEMIDNGVVFAEEQLVVEEFFAEEAPANATGPAVSTDQPVIKRKTKRFAKYKVDKVVNPIQTGRKIVSAMEFANKYPNSATILVDSVGDEYVIKSSELLT